MNILIVDDDLTSLKLLRAQLEAEGHAVFEAYDGVDALTVLEGQRVDAVISDVLMPRMDGYRLCHEIRKHARLHDLPIIIYTSTYTSLDDENLALDVGADKYLKKPTSVETVIAALHEVTAMPHAARHTKALQQVEVPKEYSEKLVSKLKEKNTELMAQTEMLRVSEENFRHSLDDSPLGVCIVTAEDETMYANRAILDIYGFSSLEELKTTPVEKRYTAESYIEYKKRYARRQQVEDSPSEYEVSIVRKNGEVRHLLVSRKGQLWNGKKQYQTLYRDITERRQAEEEKVKQLDELRRWQTVTLGREGRIGDLKREVNALATRWGEKPRYGSVEAN